MTDTCGPTWQMPFAYYDPDTSSVRTSQATFPWDSTPSSPTLPPWGSMRGGELFERPTPAPLTAARDCSSSQLPTPHANASTGPGQQGRDGKSLEIEAQRLLPTPVASDSQDRRATENWGGTDLVSTIKGLASAPTLPLLPDGSTSSDDQPLLPLNLDGTTDPD